MQTRNISGGTAAALLRLSGAVAVIVLLSVFPLVFRRTWSIRSTTLRFSSFSPKSVRAMSLFSNTTLEISPLGSDFNTLPFRPIPRLSVR